MSPGSIRALAGERDALHPAAGDDQLVDSGRAALEHLLAVDEILAQARDALTGRVLERHAGVVAHELATISSSRSDGKVAGLGKPPASERTPSGLPARIVVSSAAAWFRARRAKVTMPWHDTEMDSRDGLTRRDALGLVGGAVAGAWLFGRVELASGFEDGHYWAFADRCQRLLEDLWSPWLGHYQSGGRGETSLNANLLFTHAAAALAGHRGPARQDERARAIAWRLCQVPPWRPPGTAPPPSGSAWDQTHDWGWGAALDSHEHQHVAIDAAVVSGLAQTWLARAPLATRRRLRRTRSQPPSTAARRARSTPIPRCG